MGVWVYAPMDVHVEARGFTCLPLSLSTGFFFLKQCLLLKLKLTLLMNLTGQRAPGPHLSPVLKAGTTGTQGKAQVLFVYLFY